MPTDLDYFISEVLKLYDTNADLKYSDYVQQKNVPDSDNATMESPCLNSRVNEAHQSSMVPANKESCIECFRLLYTHLKVLFNQPG